MALNDQQDTALTANNGMISLNQGTINNDNLYEMLISTCLSHSTYTPSFKTLDDFSSWEKFVKALFPKQDQDIEKNIIEIKYTESNKDFEKLKNILKENFGIESWQNVDYKTLLLSQNAPNLTAKNLILKFSGNIHTNTSLLINANIVALEDTNFSGKSYITLKQNSSDNIVYIKNSTIDYLSLKSSNIWIAGETIIKKLTVTDNSPGHNGEYCTINIGHGRSYIVENYWTTTCANINGILFSNSTSIKNARDNSFELYMAPESFLHAAMDIDIISADKNGIIANYGQMIAKRMDIDGGPILLNSGNISFWGKGESTINLRSLQNNNDSLITSNGTLTITIQDHSSNIGRVEARYLFIKSLFNSAVNLFSGGNFYNNGTINTNNFTIANTAQILNDFGGKIYAHYASFQTVKDVSQKSNNEIIINRGGEIHIGNFKAIAKGIFSDNYGDIKAVLSANITTDAVFVYLNCHLNTTFNFNFQNDNKAVAASSKALTSAFDISQQNQGSKVFFGNNAAGSAKFFGNVNMGVLPRGLTANALPAPDNQNNLSNCLYLGGDIKDGILHIGDNREVCVGKEMIKNLISQEPTSGAIDDQKLKVGMLIMNNNSTLIIGEDGRVFTSDFKAQNASIKGIGRFRGIFEVDKKAEFYGTIVLENIDGAMPGHTIEKEVKYQLSDSRIYVKGDLFNKGMIEVLSDSILLAKAFNHQGQISGAGGLEIRADSFIMHTIVKTVEKFISNHNFIESYVENAPKIDLGGSLIIDVKDIASFEGVSIKAGDKISIRVSEGNILVIPAQLYQKIHSWWGANYDKKESLDYILSEFSGNNGIELYSAKGTALYAPKFSANNAHVLLKTDGDNLVEGVVEMSAEEHYRRSVSRSFWSKKVTTSFDHWETHTPILASFNGVSEFLLETGGNSTIRGMELYAKDGSTIKIGKEGMSLLSEILPLVKIVIHNHSHSKSRSLFGFLPIRHSHHINSISHSIPIVNFFESEGGFEGYVNGKWIQVGTSIKVGEGSDIKITATENIEIRAAYKTVEIFEFHEEMKFSFTGSLSTSEVSFGVKWDTTKSKHWRSVITPVVAELVGNLHINAPELFTEGFSGSGGILNVTVQEWKDAPATGGYHDKIVLTEISAAAKFGVKSNLGALIKDIENTASGLNNGTPEGAINAGFAGYSAYLNAAKMFGKGGAVFRVGAWLELHASRTFQTFDATSQERSHFSYAHINIDADKLDFEGSVFEAFDCYIQAKEIKASSTKQTSDSKYFHVAVDVDIPLTGASSGIGIGLAGAKGKNHSVQNLHFVLNVINDLKLHISGKADFGGVTISAKSVDASFGELMLRSIKDLVESEGFGASIGLNLSDDQKSKIGGGLGANYNKGYREVINEISSIIGKDNVHIVVAGALHLVGGMIANAERDPVTGEYTDLGNLVLTVGEIFADAIYQVDEGITLGAAVNFGQTPKGAGQNRYTATFGYRDTDGWVYPTIGSGEIRAKVTGDLNRDINQANTGLHGIDIDPITMIYQTPNDDDVWDDFRENMKNGNGFFGAVTNKIANDFHQALSDSLKILDNLAAEIIKITEKLSKMLDSDEEKVKLQAELKKLEEEKLVEKEKFKKKIEERKASKKANRQEKQHFPEDSEDGVGADNTATNAESRANNNKHSSDTYGPERPEDTGQKMYDKPIGSVDLDANGQIVDGVDTNNGMKYFMKVVFDKAVDDMVGHAYVGLGEGDDAESARYEYSGKYPAEGWPIDAGKIKDETRYGDTKNYKTIAEVRIEVTKDEYFNAIEYKDKEKANPGGYNAFNNNCVKFVQKVYHAAGQKGDFTQHFNKYELHSSLIGAAIFADIKYITAGELFNANNIEEIMNKHGIPREQIREVIIYGVGDIPRKEYMIIPK